MPAAWGKHVRTRQLKRAGKFPTLGQTVKYLQAGVQVLIADLFPPTPRDPARIQYRAWIEPLSVAESLPDLPLFLASRLSIPVPLEATDATAWNASLEALREALG